MPDVTCIGVDPAPSKRGSTVATFHVSGDRISFQAPIVTLDHGALRELLSSAAPNDGIRLLAWDAPLTGPMDPDVPTSLPSDFTKRPIEQIFKASTLPPGVSVQGFAGCQHWTITRNLLGLPRVGPFDAPLSSLPYKLVDQFPLSSPLPPKMVVEVHPVLAMWIWIGGADVYRSDLPSFDYKVKSSVLVRRELVDKLMEAWRIADMGDIADQAHDVIEELVASSDALDAFIAGALAALLARGRGEVKVHGTLHTGTFLLPVQPQIIQLLGGLS